MNDYYVIDYTRDNYVAFKVTAGDIQRESLDRIGRKLTDDELDVAIKAVEAGLSFDLDTVFTAAVEGAVEYCQDNHPK